VGLKSIADHQKSVKYKSTTIKTYQPDRTATSSKDRQIGAYSIGLTFLGKLALILCFTLFKLNVSIIMILSLIKVVLTETSRRHTQLYRTVIYN
jgi:hypothetical protein